MTDRELIQQALEKLEFFENMKSVSKNTKELITALRERLAQPVQEPFCYHDGRNIVGKEFADHSDVFPLYTSPPQRTWVGLTDDEIDEKTDFRATVRYFEAKLKERNT
jgi:hypothetical protein